jgi:hypothetical protein
MEKAPFQSKERSRSHNAIFRQNSVPDAICDFVSKFATYLLKNAINIANIVTFFM